MENCLNNNIVLCRPSKKIYSNMLKNIVSANVITQYTADRMVAMLQEKKTGTKIKKYITDLLGLLTLLEEQ